MKFLVKPLNDKARELYSNHTTYFEGDSGLDLFIVEDCEILPGQTKLIGSGVSCQLEENGKYYGDSNGEAYPIQCDYAPYFYEAWKNFDLKKVEFKPIPALASTIEVLESETKS